MSFTVLDDVLGQTMETIIDESLVIEDPRPALNALDCLKHIQQGHNQSGLC